MADAERPNDADPPPDAGAAASPEPHIEIPTAAAPALAASMPPGKAGTGAGLIVGLLISVLLSAALVIPAAKAGITPGVSPLVVLFGWVAFGAAMGPRLKRFLAIAQVTGSAGAAVTAGVVFTAPIMQIVYVSQGEAAPPVDIPLLIVASLSGALLGFGFVGLATKRFLVDPRLPAPEAVAAARMIETAVEHPDRRPRLSTSLIPGLVGGFVVNTMLLIYWLQEEVHRVTVQLPFGGSGATADPATGDATTEGATSSVDIELPIPIAPLYLGIGALLTLPTALLIFAGGLVNATTQGVATARGMPDTTFRWVGGAAMTVAVLYSLIEYVREGRQGRRQDAEEEAAVIDAAGDPAGAEALSAGGLPDEAPIDMSLLKQSAGIKMMLFTSILGGVGLLLLMMNMLGATPTQLAVLGAVAFVLVFFLSGLGALLSLQVGSSASPVSGTVFMGMLVLSIAALGISMSGLPGIVLLVPILVAACVAICAANDSSQDYKTMQINGFKVTDGFVGQLIGLIGGAVAVPLALWLANDAYGLGTESASCPQASFFGTVLESLFLESLIPWGVVGIGAVLGLIAVGLEAVGKSRGLILSSLAFAVGIYLPSYIGTGIMIGALARFLASFRINSSTHTGILVAAGLITGDAFAALIIGVIILTTGVKFEEWAAGNGNPSWFPTEVLAEHWGQILLGVLAAFILLNYIRIGRRRA